MRPYDLYIRFIITKGVASCQDLNVELERLGLHTCAEDEFKKAYEFVHKTVTTPVSTQIIEKKTHGEFYKWMKVLDVAELWDYERVFFKESARIIRLCYDVHHDPQLRITLNALLIKGCKHIDISQDLSAKFASMILPAHVAIYEKFFWNVRRMTRKDWRTYLRTCDEHETHILFTALTESLDVVRTTLDMPSRVSISESLQYLFTMSVIRAKRYLRLDHPAANAEARNWIKTVLVLADKYSKHRTGDAADFSKTLQLEFEYVEESFPTPDDALLSELKEKQKTLEEAERAKDEG